MTFPGPPHVATDYTPEFFEQCYTALAKKIDDETATPHDPNPGKESQPIPRPDKRLQAVNEALADLSRWRTYAFDGDVSLIPHLKKGGPGVLLQTKATDLGDAKDLISGAVSDMPSKWDGEGADHAQGYLQATQDLAARYSDEGGYVYRAARLTEDAISAVLAFKHDLYNLAKQASDALDNIDRGGSFDPASIGLILSAAGALAGPFGEGAVATAAFGGAVLSALGTLTTGSIQEPEANSPAVGGTYPVEIMRSLASETEKVATQYDKVAYQVGVNMEKLWTQLTIQATHRLKRPR